MIDCKAGEDYALKIIAKCRILVMFDTQLDMLTKTQIDITLYHIQCYLLIDQIGEYRNGY
jgi:hypothetical protein